MSRIDIDTYGSLASIIVHVSLLCMPYWHYDINCHFISESLKLHVALVVTVVIVLVSFNYIINQYKADPGVQITITVVLSIVTGAVAKCAC